MFIIYSEKLILLAKKTKAFFWQQNKLWWAYQEMLFWKITAQSVLILCVWNPSYLMVAVFVSWFLYLQPILFHRKFLKERKKKSDIIKWHFTLEKHFREWISPKNERWRCVFHEFFFLTQRNKGKVFIVKFFYSCSESPLITDLCKALQLGSNKFLSLHGHMMKWLLTEVNWAWKSADFTAALPLSQWVHIWDCLLIVNQKKGK